MHMVTFFITVFEIVMLVFQVIYFLQRPSDRKRLQYLILLSFLILYNLCSGLFPDPRISIPLMVQTIAAFLVGFLMSMYVVYYFYKVLDLTHLKFFATYGLILFLLVPFLFLFVVPLLLTGDSELSRKLTVVIPFIYALGFIYSTTKAFVKKYRFDRKGQAATNDALQQHAIAAYIGMLCWASLPVIVYFGDFQVLEHSVTNAGFLMMTVIYVKQSIKQARKEFDLLQTSQRSLQELNTDLQRKVEDRTKKFEELYQQRKTTFSNLAHETKTPLTLINNYLNVYTERNGDSRELQIIRANIQRLTKDVINFLDLDRVDKGFLIYDHNQVSDFSRALEIKAELFKSIALKKNIDVHFSIEKGIKIKGHPGAIDRIINNVIDNAIKYTPPHGSVDVCLARKSSKIEFDVIDTGVGIPKDLTERVFEPYFQISSEQKSGEGMGLGLPIVSKIVKDLGGDVLINSNAHRGTRATVVLNELLEADEVLADPETEIKISEPDIFSLQDSVKHPSAPYVMIIEDNADLLTLLKESLEREFNIIVAKDGEEGLQKTSLAKQLDLIVSDVRMPGLDGFAFCKRLYDQEKFAHIPVIFLSANGDYQRKLDAFKLGAIDYIQKPFVIEEVIEKVKSVLGNQRRIQHAIVKSASQMLLATTSEGNVQRRDAEIFESNCARYNLSKRESEILSLLNTGKPYKLIADSLAISITTVQRHIANIFRKLNVNNKVAAIKKIQEDKASSM